MTLENRRALSLEYTLTSSPFRRREIIQELEADKTLHVSLVEIDGKPLTTPSDLRNV